MATGRRYPIGEQDFANIHKDDLLFIDKTTLVYDIVRSREVSFVSNFVKGIRLGKLKAFMKRSRYDWHQFLYGHKKN